MIKFSDTEINSYPFPHAATNNAIRQELFMRLIEEFPDYEEVKQYENVMGGRRRLSSNTAQFYEFLSRNPSWKSLYEYINSYKDHGLSPDKTKNIKQQFIYNKHFLVVFNFTK